MNEVNYVIQEQIIDIFDIVKYLKRNNIEKIKRIIFDDKGEMIKLSYSDSDNIGRTIKF